MSSRSWKEMIVALALGASSTGCMDTWDLGTSDPRGLLPVDARNPMVISNDGAYEGWFGEYAVLLANGGGPRLAGILVNATNNWPDLDANLEGYRRLVAAARASGLRDIPDPIPSVAPPLVRPASGEIDATVGNSSTGAQFIVDSSRRFSTPYRPVVVLTGGSLTDVADAYLLDHSVSERVVVVSRLGVSDGRGAIMSAPNGALDPWADAIVAAKFRYVQVSTSYDQRNDVPASLLAKLPNNAFGTWVRNKQPQIDTAAGTNDHVAVAAVGIVGVVVAPVTRASSEGPVGAGATMGPNLVGDSNGSAWIVGEVDGAAATERFQKLLLVDR